MNNITVQPLWLSAFYRYTQKLYFVIFSYPSILTFGLGAQKNRLIETVLRDCSFEYKQHMFLLKNKKTIFTLRTLNLEA